MTAWLEDERVRKISFTGSTGVGRQLLGQAADRVVNTSMELGGNAPFVVGPDADVAAAVEGAMLAKFRNGGQACTAANRFYVHADVVDDFVARFGAEIEALSVGPAFEDHQIGPLITAKARTKVVELLDQATAVGATVSHRSAAPDGPGHFHPAVLVTDVPPDAQLLAEEVFGPVAPVVTWTSDDEVVALVNGTEFGLSAYVFGSLGWALPFAERIDAGMVGVNRGLVSDPAAPFGGVKQSGIGREGSREGIREYQETQYFSVDWPASQQ
ncbi:aldehyde dehydrogenase family protein [Nocardioides alcanivorans]|uniref:aldehyde dehydrogenase family protein n=1 Tax=Nocardioides alcanivorans TaxID=2897352 RepID=UPI00289BC27D|nr:aldehyde dehydrogenase family protein [Nocardioides alcanivorans]